MPCLTPATFTPPERSYGAAISFWGACCQHYTVPNTTDVTRVCLDFRVVPRSCHDHVPSLENRFAVGGFYAEMDADGRLLTDASARMAAHERTDAVARTNRRAAARSAEAAAPPQGVWEQAAIAVAAGGSSKGDDLTESRRRSSSSSESEEVVF